MQIDFSLNDSRQKTICLGIVIGLATFLSFFKLGNDPLYEWDESRYAIIAHEMILHHDYVNYYFFNSIDPTVSKPPLYLWAITIGYRLFGYNEFALRFFSALATVFFFLVFFQWVSLYKNYKVAFYSCLILMSCKAIIGYHAGRTGDTDSFLLLFTFLTLLHFSKYVDFDKKNSILWSGIFLGLAFYSKDTAAFLILPALFLFILIRRKLFIMLKDLRFWLAAFLFLAIAGSWYFLVIKFGIPFTVAGTETTNNWQLLFYYDTLMRFTHAGLGGNAKDAHDYLYYFKTLDSRFNLWNYLLYLLTAVFLVQNFSQLRFHFQKPFYLLLTSTILITCTILTLSLTKLGWYMAPIIPMLAVLTVLLIESVSKKFRIVKIISLALFAFTLSRQFILFNLHSNNRGLLVRDNKNIFQGASQTLWYNNKGEQDLYAYFNWYSKKLGWVSIENLLPFETDTSSVLFGKTDVNLVNYLKTHPQLKHKERDNYTLVYR